MRLERIESLPDNFPEFVEELLKIRARRMEKLEDEIESWEKR